MEEEEDVGEVGGGHDLFKNRIRWVFLRGWWTVMNGILSIAMLRELREIGVSSDDDEKREGQKREVVFILDLSTTLPPFLHLPSLKS